MNEKKISNTKPTSESVHNNTNLTLDENSIIEEAKLLASKGFCVIPCTKGEKRPLGCWSKYKAVDWSLFKPDIDGFGCLCGLSNVAVIDIDVQNGGVAAWDLIMENLDGYEENFIDATPCEITTSGGFHYYFKDDKRFGNGKNNCIVVDGKKVGIDLKSGNGFIRQAPSRHVGEKEQKRPTLQWKRHPTKTVIQAMPERLIKLVIGEMEIRGGKIIPVIEARSYNLETEEILTEINDQKRDNGGRALTIAQVREIYMSIDTSHATGRDDWLKSLWALQRYGIAHGFDQKEVIQLGDDFSKRTTANNYFSCREVRAKMMEYNSGNNKPCTLGTVIHWLKIENPEAYRKIFAPPIFDYASEFQEYLTDCGDIIVDVDGNFKLPSQTTLLSDDYEIVEGDKKIIGNEPEPSKQTFNKEDGYFWIDFLRHIRNTKFNSYTQAKEYVLYNLPRVWTKIEEADPQAIFKTNNESKLFDLVKFKKDWCNDDVKYKVIEEKTSQDEEGNEIKTSKTIIKSIKLIKLVHKEISKIPIYSSIVCQPDIKKLKTGEFNLWQGLQATQVEEVDDKIIEPLLWFIKNIWCKNDEVLYSFFMKWLAFMMQNPGKKTKVAMAVASEQGCGKNTLTDFLCDFIFGDAICLPNVAGIASVVGEKNKLLLGKKLVVINEMASTKDVFRSEFDKLKTYITEESIQIRAMYREHFTIKQYTEFMLLTNHIDSLIIENKKDRRYCVLELCDSKINDKKYFSRLREQIMNQECGNHFYTYLMNYDCSDFMQLHIPETSARNEMIEISSNSVEKFISVIKLQIGLEQEERERLFHDIPNSMTATSIFGFYKAWCEQNNEHALSKTKFGLYAKKLIERKLIKTGTIYVLKADPID